MHDPNITLLTIFIITFLMGLGLSMWGYFGMRS